MEAAQSFSETKVEISLPRLRLSRYLRQMPVSWLHICDLHSGGDTFGTEYLGGHLLKFLRHRKQSSASMPDFIVFSGDIANKGKSDEFEVFINQFLLPLMELYGDGIVNNIVFIPGNHDVDRKCHLTTDTYSICDKHLSIFDCNAMGLELRKDLVERFSAYQAALPCQQDISALFGEAAHFTRTISVDKVTVGIVGINTAWLCQSDQDKGQLSPGKFGLTRGLEAIAGCAVRIVVGHHPTSWFRSGDREAIEALLAQYNAIYLHGHLHETSVEYNSRGGSEFLNLQAGALFESRDALERPNTILFSRYDESAEEVVIEPFSWKPSLNEWGVSCIGMPERLRIPGQASWRFPVPVHKIPKNILLQKNKQFELPNGWVEINRQSLERWSASEQTTEQLLSYFDGRPPRWQDVAGIHIPHRKAVGRTVNEVILKMMSPGASLFLVTGPGGEGKSTALRQMCCALLRRNPDLRVIFRNDDEQGLPSGFILNDLPKTHPWLIVADEASNLVNDIYFQQQLLNKSAGPHVSYIVASRDTDWIANRGRAFDWAAVTFYQEIIFRGIEIDDAKSVIAAWSQYGKAGLQKLHSYSTDQAADMLVAASRHEEQSSDGAFLGAMLTVRYGKELRNHIDSILKRLAQVPSVAGRTLLDGFSAIVAIDRLGLSILTKEVLAKYLGCKATEIRRHVINPLGDEALVAVGGGFILTRHRAIAAVAYELLELKYDIDFVELYQALVTASMLLIREGKFVPNVSKWRFLSRTLFELGEHGVAIEVAKTVVSLDPHNSYFIVHLASLHRATGRNDLALLAFRTAGIESNENRGFFTEWSAVERMDQNYFAAIWLISIGINDGQSSKDITNDDAKMALNGLCICGREAFRLYNQTLFLRVAKCARAIALSLPLAPDERNSFEGIIGDHGELDVDRFSDSDKIDFIREGAVEARVLCGDDFKFLPNATRGLAFTSLLRLVARVQTRRNTGPYST